MDAEKDELPSLADVLNQRAMECHSAACSDEAPMQSASWGDRSMAFEDAAKIAAPYDAKIHRLEQRVAELERERDEAISSYHALGDADDKIIEAQRERLEKYDALAREAADDNEPDVKTKTECWVGWRNRMTMRHKALAALAPKEPHQ